MDNVAFVFHIFGVLLFVSGMVDVAVEVTGPDRRDPSSPMRAAWRRGATWCPSQMEQSFDVGSALGQLVLERRSSSREDGSDALGRPPLESVLTYEGTHQITHWSSAGP